MHTFDSSNIRTNRGGIVFEVEAMQKMPQQPWCKIGTLYKVKKYKYQATVEGATNRCSCANCIKFREGRQLFNLFEVFYPEDDRGKLLFADCCRIVSS